MTNLITKTTDLAMTITLQYVKSGDTVVDATCGTGQDTVSLAKAVGDEGTVYAFDIQQDAIDQTEQRLKDCGLGNVKLIKDSFVRMAEYISDESVSVAVFNLGYLPGGDHSITKAVFSGHIHARLQVEMIDSKACDFLHCKAPAEEILSGRYSVVLSCSSETISGRRSGR